MEYTQTDTPKDSKQNKVRRITIRLTEQEYSELTENAAACGMHKSTYAHDRLIGQPPHLLMTDEQAEALSSLTAARSELVGIRNALNGRTQDERKVLFKNDRLMTRWIGAVNTLIKRWAEIADKFK